MRATQQPSNWTHEGQFITTDVDFVAYADLLGVRPSNILPPTPETHPRRTAFAFDANAPAFHQLLETWQSYATAELSPRRYAEAKLRIYGIVRSLTDGGAR